MKSDAVKQVFGSISIAKQVPFTYVESAFDAPIVAIAGLTKVVFTPTWSVYVNGSTLLVAELSSLYPSTINTSRIVCALFFSLLIDQVQEKLLF